LNVKQGFTGKHFWSKGYCVSTVGLDEQMIRAYIRGCLKSSGCCKPMQHQTRHREVNHHLTTLGQPFIIFAQAA
jgi:hypothetical protein